METIEGEPILGEFVVDVDVEVCVRDGVGAEPLELSSSEEARAKKPSSVPLDFDRFVAGSDGDDLGVVEVRPRPLGLDERAMVDRIFHVELT